MIWFIIGIIILIILINILRLEIRMRQKFKILKDHGFYQLKTGEWYNKNDKHISRDALKLLTKKELKKAIKFY